MKRKPASYPDDASSRPSQRPRSPAVTSDQNTPLTSPPPTEYPCLPSYPSSVIDSADASYFPNSEPYHCASTSGDAFSSQINSFNYLHPDHGFRAFPAMCSQTSMSDYSTMGMPVTLDADPQRVENNVRYEDYGQLDFNEDSEVTRPGSTTPLIGIMDNIAIADDCEQENPECMELDNEVCYGMLVARAQMIDPTTDVQGKPQVFEITLWNPGCYVLLLPTEEPYAVIDTSTTAVFDDLAQRDLKPLRFQAILTETNSAQNTQYETKDYHDIEVNIYGPISIMNDVGKSLTKLKRYLQQPIYVDSDVVYDNPHFFKVNSELTPWIEREHKEASPAAEPSGFQPSLDELVNNVLDNELGRAHPFDDIQSDPRIKTPLLSHQREALAFIGRRESGVPLDTYSLWERVNHADSSGYRNMVNGHFQQDPPQEPRGGIIADEMGLGKTLTMISAIAGSLDQAAEFAQSHMGCEESSTQKVETMGTRNIKSTLVIVPLSVLSEWADEVFKHTVEGSMTCHKYHGKSKINCLNDYDIILTTYHTVLSDFSHRYNSSPLYTCKWFRIVLDEAHIIRNCSAKQFRAIYCLTAERRWCLSGTPLQNSLNDLASLFQFLQVYPVNTRTLFRLHIIAPLRSNTRDESGIQKLRLLLTAYCLRRKHSTVAQSTCNPNITEMVRKLYFTSDEKTGYANIKTDCKSLIEVAANSLQGRDYFTVFQAIMRLRLFCNHALTVVPQPSVMDSSCSICGITIAASFGSENWVTGFVLDCRHAICTYCLPQESIEEEQEGDKRQLQCPLCQKICQVVEQGKNAKPKRKNDMSQNTASADSTIVQLPVLTPTKIQALLADIQDNPENRKSIVFSCWVRSLDLVETVLKGRNVGYVRIDGKLSFDDRQKVLRRFREESGIMVLLMTTGAGAVGLNLTIASRVHLLEPQWNPMVEGQAIGRVARLGQTQPVFIYRYIMAGTIEEHIQACQRRKLALTKFTLDMPNGEQSRDAVVQQRLKELESWL